MLRLFSCLGLIVPSIINNLGRGNTVIIIYLVFFISSLSAAVFASSSALTHQEKVLNRVVKHVEKEMIVVIDLSYIKNHATSVVFKRFSGVIDAKGAQLICVDKSKSLSSQSYPTYDAVWSALEESDKDHKASIMVLGGTVRELLRLDAYFLARRYKNYKLFALVEEYPIYQPSSMAAPSLSEMDLFTLFGASRDD